MIYHFKIWDDRTEALGKVFQGKPGVTAASVIEEIASLAPIHLYGADNSYVTLYGLEATTFRVETEENYRSHTSEYILQYTECKKVIMSPNFIFTGTLDDINAFCQSFKENLSDKLPKKFLKIEVKENA